MVSASPLIPLNFFKNRTRVVTNFTTLFFSSAFFSYFFLLTLFEQQILHYSAIRSGLSYLPFGLTIGAGIGIGTALMPKIGVKPLLATGFFTCAVGMALTSTISVDAQYWAHIFPGMVVLGIGSGLTFPAIGNACLHEVTEQDSSLASGVQSAMQQIGGALGLSVLVTFGLRHAATQLGHGIPRGLAFTHGYILSYRIGVGLLLIGGLLVLALLEHVSSTPRSPLATLAPGDPAPTDREPLAPIAKRQREPTPEQA
jgi:MFS family permease